MVFFELDAMSKGKRYNYELVTQQKKFGLMGIPEPQCDEEFALLAEWYLGKPLSLRYFSVYGRGCSYEIEQNYDDYAISCGGPNQYDAERALMAHCFGVLICGGTSRSNYGQTKIDGHRKRKMLLNWQNNRRSRRVCSPRKPFLRLADQPTKQWVK